MLDLVLASSGARVVPRAPCVVALCDSFPEAGGGEALRAELRGLGAELVVMTPLRGFWIVPDGETRALLPSSSLLKSKGRAPLVVLVYDEQFRLRLRQEAEAAVPVEAVLLAAIRGASRGVGRRELLASALVASLGLALSQACASLKTHDVPPPIPEGAGATFLDLNLIVNGEKRTLHLDPRTTLLDALRESLALTGTKKGCEMGQCGACTVLLDGVRVNSCLQLAAMCDGRKITTIEGLSKGDHLHPMQQAFVDCDAFQCGYCTPGQILSAIGLLNEGRPAGDDEIREAMSGNLCRCGAYPNIVQAIQRVST
jgi:xanthine dehydrogenase YagT iron-sulfur-binding subunit